MAGGAPAPAPNPKLAGSALDLGRFTCTAPDGEDPSACRALTDYSGFAYDPRNHQMLAFGGGHATTMTDSVVALVLGGALTWQSLYVPTPCSMMVPANLDAARGAWKAGTGGPYPRPVSAHTYDFHGVAPELNEFILLGRSFTGRSCSNVGNDVGGPIAHFDLSKQTWSFSADVGTSKFTDGLAGTAWDPMTRKFLSLGTAGLSLYDPAKRTMQHVAARRRLGQHLLRLRPGHQDLVVASHRRRQARDAGLSFPALRSRRQCLHLRDGLRFGTAHLGLSIQMRR